MKRIIASRASGKSTELLRMALENHGNIAVFNSHAVETFVVLARDVLHIAPEEIHHTFGIAKIRDVTVASILEYETEPRQYNRSRPLYIDEISACMKSLLFPFQVRGYTESLEEPSCGSAKEEAYDDEKEA